MKTHNFILGPVDTDSISFCKQDMSPFSKEEQDELLAEINSYNPELIRYDHDGYFDTIVVIRAKNYILYDGKKIKIKGSALKASMKEKALKEFINKVIECLVFDRVNEIETIYNSYIKEIYNLTDITRWTSKKTITDSVLNPERSTEQKILDSLNGKQVQMGDKIYVYFAEPGPGEKKGPLKLQEDWNNDHDPKVLAGKLFDTVSMFETVLPMDRFPNYALVKNQNTILRELLGLPPIVKEKKTRAKKDLQTDTQLVT